MNSLSMELACYIRFHSFKQIVIFIIMISVYLLLTLGMQKLFPNLSEKATNTICGIAIFILTLILLYVVDA